MRLDEARSGSARRDKARRGKVRRGKVRQGKEERKMTSPHPEWKRLYEKIGTLIAAGKIEFSYAELQAISGVDIRSTRGRGQFFRFRNEALMKLSIWFENQPTIGYRIIPASEHVNSASLRVGRARKMTGRALKIAVHTKFELLDDAEKSASLAAQAAIGTLYLAMKETVLKTRKIAGAIEHPKLAAVIGVKNLV